MATTPLRDVGQNALKSLSGKQIDDKIDDAVASGVFVTEASKNDFASNHVGQVRSAYATGSETKRGRAPGGQLG